jgi:hypothetical protein
MAAKPIPEGYHSVTPYLYAKGAAQAIEFYNKGSLGRRTDSHHVTRRQSRPRRDPDRRFHHHADSSTNFMLAWTSGKRLVPSKCRQRPGGHAGVASASSFG